jgi:hypothetical protein
VPLYGDLAQLLREQEAGLPQKQLEEQQKQNQLAPPTEALPPQPPVQGGKGKPSKPPSKGRWRA